MVKVSAQTLLLICCYFPCTRQADMGGSKKERQFCSYPSLFCQFGWSMDGRGCLFWSLCPSCCFLLFVLLQSFPRHSSSISQHSATLGSKFTCQAEKTTYLPHFYRSPSPSIILYPLPCNLSSFKRVVNLTSSLAEAQPGNTALQPSGCSLQSHTN